MKLREWAILLAAFLGFYANTAEFDARLKWFTTLSALPPDDVRRTLTHTPTLDHSADIRLMFKHQGGPWSFEVDHATTWVQGDSYGVGGLTQGSLDRAPDSDAARLMSLTWDLDEGRSHRAFHRLDRFAMSYRNNGWGVTVGRQAVSWGSGRVFQPLDLFNPFGPTAVDRDYKPGDDVILVERLFPNGSDLQLLTVGRRRDGSVRGDESSYALKWHGYMGESEVELLGARHIGDDILGLMLRVPVGPALIRSDIAASRVGESDWYVSAIVNADYSFSVGDRSAYVFGEYFHNAFGVDRLDPAGVQLPSELADRVARGELFNVMQDYLALGLQYQWHPILGQTATLITNLHDKSHILQTQVDFNPGDHSRLQIGVVASIGESGEEFGGLPVLPDLTVGGGVSGFMRWVYYL